MLFRSGNFPARISAIVSAIIMGVTSLSSMPCSSSFAFIAQYSSMGTYVSERYFLSVKLTVVMKNNLFNSYLNTDSRYQKLHS